MVSGLYDELTGAGLLISHERSDQCYSGTWIQPERVQFISYPYEWSFSQLKAAALVTLEIARRALARGLILKDASAFNIQWFEGNWLLIDTASFGIYEEGKPWQAYGQFLRHFLGPLALMSHRGPEMQARSWASLGGIRPSEAWALLSMRAKANRNLALHLGLSTWAERHMQSPNRITTPSGMPKARLEALLRNLESTVRGLHYKPQSKWLQYQQDQEADYTEAKSVLVRQLQGAIDASSYCDIGANDGRYSPMMSFDHSPLYKRDGGKEILIDTVHDCVNAMATAQTAAGCPLVVDIANPTPARGWAGAERKSFLERLGTIDLIQCLALIHHLCLRQNVPLGHVAKLLSQHCHHLIIEWVPPEDPRAQQLAAGRVFPPYSQALFESEFGRHFQLVSKSGPLGETQRCIYHFAR